MNLSAPDAHFFEKEIYRQSFLSRILHQQQIVRVFGAFRAAGIEPILIKGWSLARFYPADKPRMIGDIDVCVEPADYKLAEQTLKNPQLAEILIDLHRGLRHLDKLPYRDLFNNSRLVDLMNVKVRVLRPEDGFRVTCVHWLTDGGANREKLWDIYYLIANRPPDFDWERCLNAAGKKRRQWFICTIALAHRYLNLDVSDLPFADEIIAPAAIPQWLSAALEKEWGDPVVLSRMDKILGDWQLLKQQLHKRFPPNPITASIDTEAPFDNTPRLPYQIADIGLRFVWGFRRLSAAALERLLPLKSNHPPDLPK